VPCEVEGYGEADGYSNAKEDMENFGRGARWEMPYDSYSAAMKRRGIENSEEHENVRKKLSH
jgi:hypothetical protein